MPSFTSILPALLAVSSTVTAIPHRARQAQTGRAAYFMTNEDQNSIVAVPIGNDGSLSGGTVTATGGQGSVSIDGMTMEPAATDPLIGQSAVNIAGNMLFAVNAGSNSLSMFCISEEDPTQLTLVGEPVDIPAEFPNTVAASMSNGLVCAGSTGAVAGVSCANFDQNGIGQMDELRPFNIGQSTPPVGPTNSVSQVFWSEDETMLFTTVKGDPEMNKTGFLSAFEVQAGGAQPASLAQQDVQSSPEGTAVLFGTLPIPGSSNLFATDASFGGAIISVDGAMEGTLEAMQEIDGQMATCWVTISEATGSAFVTDVGVAGMTEMSLEDASILDEIDLSDTGAPGVIDLASQGNFVYALAPDDAGESQILVMDVSGGSGNSQMMQAFGLNEIGAGARSQGMAILA